jgi:hypothetical protein
VAGPGGHSGTERKMDGIQLQYFVVDKRSGALHLHLIRLRCRCCEPTYHPAQF